ncbi:Peptidase [Streptomyces sp. GBA 94-10 4N24]|uniref:murein hydrolase activator EnvC family protein n=1 Tax=Streptomyces TaxID=1883 RepID=UPI0003C3254A|nr:Peptidase [Streptomyces sp. GBA 94-10 4N24]ESQ05420.1 Peptidase [Streptomyces sp. PVA_94-07]UZN58329.1 Peptidase [Streptomyces sp. GBA 94-10 4N24]
MNTESYALAGLVRHIARTAFSPRARRSSAKPAPGGLDLFPPRAAKTAPTARSGVLGAQLYWATTPGHPTGPPTARRSVLPRGPLARAGTVLLCTVAALALASAVRAADPPAPAPPPPPPTGDGTAASSKPRPTRTTTQGLRQAATPPRARPSARATASRPRPRTRPASDPHLRQPDVPAPGTFPGPRSWPVGTRPHVARGWEPPATDFGPGHRGVDLSAPVGTAVRAAATGRVSFAGPVAGRGVLAIELSGSGTTPLRITYEPVRALVAVGDEVVAGQPVAVLETGTHCPHSCLHWGLLRGKEYLDPLTLLPEWMLRRGPSRLLPVSGIPESSVDRREIAAAGPVAFTPVVHHTHAPASKRRRDHRTGGHTTARRPASRSRPAGRPRRRPVAKRPDRHPGQASRGKVSRGRRRGPSPRSRR